MKNKLYFFGKPATFSGGKFSKSVCLGLGSTPEEAREEGLLSDATPSEKETARVYTVASGCEPNAEEEGDFAVFVLRRDAGEFASAGGDPITAVLLDGKAS